MKIATSKHNHSNAIIQVIGTMYLVTIGSVRKMFDSLTSATNYITSLGYQF